MVQRLWEQRFATVGLLLLALSPLSLFADPRPDWRTEGSRSEIRHNWDLEGIVVSVNPNGDDFLLRTVRGTVLVDARGGIAAWYQGRAYRIRDLEPGDRVGVDLVSTRTRWARARVVEVLVSISHGRDGRYDRRDHRGYERLQGRVVSLDVRRDRMVVRDGGGRDVIVDARQLERVHGRGWVRSVRVGERVELEGYFDGRIFVASSFGPPSGRDDRPGDRRR